MYSQQEPDQFTNFRQWVKGLFAPSFLILFLFAAIVVLTKTIGPRSDMLVFIRQTPIKGEDTAHLSCVWSGSGQEAEYKICNLVNLVQTEYDTSDDDSTNMQALSNSNIR